MSRKEPVSSSAMIGKMTTMVIVFLLTACTQAPRPQPSPAKPASCRPGALDTITEGRMTWATRSPGHVPWTIGDPADGQGYEAAVAAAVSRRLGYPANRTSWITGTATTMLGPGAKDFDVGFDQILIASQREPLTEFSSSYYDVRQAVIARNDNAAVRSVTTAAGLTSARLGAPAGSAAWASIAATVRPATPPIAFPTSDDAKNALNAGTIDALVVDLPTAFYLTTVELAGTRVVGALPQTTAEPEQFGFALAPSSPLTPCITKAVSELKQDGTLAELAAKWLGPSL